MMLSAGRTRFSTGVSTPLTGMGRPSTVTDGALAASLCSAQARSSASVVPSPSNVLHSTEDATTKTLVPGLTVHDSTPDGAKGETVRSPRSQHANAAPPVPNEFSADGVWNTAVQRAARPGSYRGATAAAPVIGAAASDAQAANRPTASRRSPRVRVIATAPTVRRRRPRGVEVDRVWVSVDVVMRAALTRTSRVAIRLKAYLLSELSAYAGLQKLGGEPVTTTTLRDSDLRAMYTLLEDAHRDAPGDILPWSLFEGLGRLIHADSVQL